MTTSMETEATLDSALVLDASKADEDRSVKALKRLRTTTDHNTKQLEIVIESIAKLGAELEDLKRSISLIPGAATSVPAPSGDDLKRLANEVTSLKGEMRLVSDCMASTSLTAALIQRLIDDRSQPVMS